MQLKEKFMLREIAGQWLLIPIGESVIDVNGIITLTESGAFLWKVLESDVTGENELADALLGEYDIDCETALESVKLFLGDLKDRGILNTCEM